MFAVHEPLGVGRYHRGDTRTSIPVRNPTLSLNPEGTNLVRRQTLLGGDPREIARTNPRGYHMLQRRLNKGTPAALLSSIGHRHVRKRTHTQNPEALSALRESLLSRAPCGVLTRKRSTFFSPATTDVCSRASRLARSVLHKQAHTHTHTHTHARTHARTHFCTVRLTFQWSAG